MAKGFQLDTHELERLMKRLNQKCYIRDDVARVVEGSAKDVSKKASERAPIDEGFLRRMVQPNRVNDLSWEVVSQSRYSAVMEFGTKKRMDIPAGLESYAQQFQNQLPKGTFKDLLRNITEWVRRKGLSGTYSVKTKRRTGKKKDRYIEDLEVAYPIALSIARYGNKPHPFFFPAYFEGRKKMIEELKALISK